MPQQIGQAIEMDNRSGPPNGAANYGLRESDGDVAGMLALQQGGFPAGAPQRRQDTASGARLASMQMIKSNYEDHLTNNYYNNSSSSSRNNNNNNNNSNSNSNSNSSICLYEEGGTSSRIRLINRSTLQTITAVVAYHRLWTRPSKCPLSYPTSDQSKAQTTTKT